MKKKFRVKSTRDFQKVIDNGNKIYSKEYIIYYLNTNTGYSRVGISVGKKILKRAVDRNYEKRVTRNIISKIYSNMIGSYDYVIICRNASISLNYDNKLQLISNLLIKKELLMEGSNDNNF
ncbi:MAG: ribonuclease P protein component [Bacilli bacterium]